MFRQSSCWIARRHATAARDALRHAAEAWITGLGAQLQSLVLFGSVPWYRDA
jgi:hypothetical protein